VSPDGKSAYASAWTSGAILVFNRNPATGTLTQKPGADGCITEAVVVGCTQAHGITAPDEILISANGKNVYVTSWAIGTTAKAAISTFTRNTTTGVLTWTACINDDASDMCTDGRAVGGHGAVLSADQKNIYVTGNVTLAAFDRNTTTGALMEQGGMGCFGADPECTAVAPDPGGRQIAISGDGKQLYVPSSAAGVMVFNRNTANGVIAPLPGGCYTQLGGGGCTKLTQIGPGTAAVTVSPDSRSIYLSHSNGIVAFARRGDGTLAFRNCVNDAGNLGCSNGAGVTDLIYLAASPDGQDVVAVGSGNQNGLVMFARNTATGALGRRAGPDGCLSTDGRVFDNGAFVNGACRTSSIVSTHGHVHFFGNGLIYAGFFDGSRIVTFKRDFYPVCTSRTIAAARNKATAIPLTCSDRNGDAIVRSIVVPPAAATLGGINQAAQSVFYSPFSGFSGTDHFAFRGTAAGLAGPAATITVNVPRPKPKHIRGVTLLFGYSAFTDHTVLNALAVKHVPRGSKVTAGCLVHKHKCPGKARKGFTKKRAKGTVSLRKRYVGVSLPVGATITVRVTKRNTFGEAKILKVRSRKAPKISTRCMRPGSRKLRKRC
jgi:hypothetical protein